MKRRIARFVKYYEWWILAFCCLVTFAMGWYGFHLHNRSLPGGATTADNFYLAVQLFSMKSGNQRNINNAYLEVARFLAPSLLALAALKAFIVLLSDQMALIRLQTLRNHVIICGLGNKGLQLMRNVQSAKQRVVIIERDVEHQDIPGCKARGAIVITGDASDGALLEKAGVSRARELFAVTGDDAVNREIARSAQRLHAASTATSCLSCHVHIFDPQLRQLFGQEELFSRLHARFKATIFNIPEESARIILARYPPDRLERDRTTDISADINVWIFGIGWAGEGILKETVRVGHYLEGRLNITAFDVRATERRDTFLSRCSGLRGSAPARFVDDVAIAFVDADVEKLFDDEIAERIGSGTPAVIYVCLGNDALGIATAIRLHRMLDYAGISIVVCMSTAIGNLSESEAFRQQYPSIHCFNMIDETCSAQVRLRGSLDQLAQYLHSTYVTEGLLFSEGDFSNTTSLSSIGRALNEYSGVTDAEGPVQKLNALLSMPDFYQRYWRKKHGSYGRGKAFASPSCNVDEIGRRLDELRRSDSPGRPFVNLSVFERERILRVNHCLLLAAFPVLVPDKIALNPSLVTWDELTEEKKDSNRHNADHIAVKLRAAGFDIEKGLDVKEVESRLSDDSLARRLAEMEHRRWMAEACLASWRYKEGCTQKDPIRRLHPDLRPFEELSAEDKKKDYDMVKAIPGIVGSESWSNYARFMHGEKNG